jgi:hypothetical protein
MNIDRLVIACAPKNPSLLGRHRLPNQEWIVADLPQLALRRRFDGIRARERLPVPSVTSGGNPISFLGTGRGRRGLNTPRKGTN